MRTHHFGFMQGRCPLCNKWYARWVQIGLIANNYADEWPPYRYGFYVYFWLIPNFIWYQDRIFQDPRIGYQYPARIIGIQSWPFDCWITRSKNNGTALVKQEDLC